MKKFSLLPIVLTAACSEISDSYVPVHIGANTNADIYVGSKMVGTTPAFVYLSPDFLKDGRITLKKQGFVDAEIKTDASFKTRKKIASTSSDKRVSGYLRAKYDISSMNVCGNARKMDELFGFSTCASTSVPAASLTQFPVSVSQYAVPYTLVEYGAQQYFVTMRRKDKDDSGTLPVQIQNLILKYYDAGRKEELAALVSKSTGLSTSYLIKRMFYDQSTPDGAAKAVMDDLREIDEIQSALERKGAVDAVNDLKKSTGLSEKILRHAVSSDKDKTRVRIAALFEFSRLKDNPHEPESLLPKCVTEKNDNRNLVLAAFLVQRNASDFAEVVSNRYDYLYEHAVRTFSEQSGVSQEWVKANHRKNAQTLTCEIVKEAERQNRIDDLILKSF